MFVATATKKWTLEELHSLPDDGNRYELVHGELFVTPPPSRAHETLVSALHSLLEPYVSHHRLGRIYRPRAVVRERPNVEVEPDLFVVPLGPAASWDDAPRPILVVEATSPSTRRRDHVHKRQLYVDLAIPTYWVFDLEERNVSVISLDHPDTVVDSRLVWQPAGADEPLIIEVASLFAGHAKPGK